MAYNSDDWLNTFMEFDTPKDNAGLDPSINQLQQEWAQPTRAATTNNENHDITAKLIVLETLNRWIYERAVSLEQIQGKILDAVTNLEKLTMRAGQCKQTPTSNMDSGAERLHPESDYSDYSDSSSDGLDRVANILAPKR